MSSLVSVKSSAHWYFPATGEACHEVPMTSKGNEGKMRNTTVADARKMGLYPSVTTIISLLDKPFLVAWKVEQAILSALTIPAIDGESVDDLARRVISDAEAQVDKARKIGSLLHDAVERYVTLHEFPADPLIAPLMQPFIAWWDENCEQAFYCETPVVGAGYAGRIDCKAKLKGIGTAIIDFKGRKPDKAGKFGTYDEDCLQLTAYREADALTRPRADACVSILMNNVPDTTPSVHIHVWPQEECDRFLMAFIGLKNLWQILKKYTPPII